LTLATGSGKTFQMSNDCRVQFVGHSCVWITLNSKHFFVDANFSPRILTLKRHGELGIDLHQLPDVSGLLVTHAHYDHLDLFSYKYFSGKKNIVAPPELGPFIQKFIANPVSELSTWESIELDGIKITAVPVHHKGWRLSGLRYQKCNGYVLESSAGTIFHAGDTAYGPCFREIGQRFKIDVACLPIGAYSPAWMMQRQHMNPVEALQAFEDLGAETMIPIHWGSFRVAMESPYDPIHWLEQELVNHSVQNKVRILYPGESFELRQLNQ